MPKDIITFKDFMDYALYDPVKGYYNTPGIGFDGADYYTSPEATPLFAQLLALQVEEIDQHMGKPKNFHFVEAGAGRGTFALDFLYFLKKINPGLYSRLSYSIIEKNPKLIKQQQERLSSFTGINWCNVDKLEKAHLFFSNEFFDALPVHRIKVVKGKIMEVYLKVDDTSDISKGVTEIVDLPSTRKISHYLKNEHININAYPEGYETEVNLAAAEYIKKFSKLLYKHGYIISIDYGYDSKDYYSIKRTTGTIRSYQNHKICKSLYTNIGKQDITAHVNFSDLIASGTRSGLTTVGLSNQISFLTSLAMSSKQHTESELADLKGIIDPTEMGNSFKVLIQYNGITAKKLSGLKLRPFFNNQ